MVYKSKNIGEVFRFVGNWKKYFDSRMVIMKKGDLVLVCDKETVGKYKNGDDKIRLTLMTNNRIFKIKSIDFDFYFIKVV